MVLNNGQVANAEIEKRERAKILGNRETCQGSGGVALRLPRIGVPALELGLLEACGRLSDTSATTAVSLK